MKTRTFGFWVLAMGLLVVSSLTSAGQEAVNGYYDSKNDWFVFEWHNHTTGKQQRIYDSSNKVKPSAHGEISFDRASGNYTYAYQVTNGAGAQQALSDIFIGHSSLVFEVSKPNPQDQWYSAEVKGKNLWHWAWIKRGAKGIPAGKTVSGLSFKSKGLPTIVNVSFSGKRRAKYGFPSPDEDSEETQASFDRVFHNLQTAHPAKFVDSVQQKTVGPIDPPVTFNAGNFIQNLITLVNQSRSQGWINNDEIANILLAKLNSALSKVTTDPKASKNDLGAFLNDVRAQNGKTLSSEAYALLYFNGQYAVNHM